MGCLSRPQTLTQFWLTRFKKSAPRHPRSKPDIWETNATVSDQTYGKKLTKNGDPMSTIHPPGDILFQATIATRRTKGFDQIHVFLVDQLAKLIRPPPEFQNSR